MSSLQARLSATKTDCSSGSVSASIRPRPSSSLARTISNNGKGKREDASDLDRNCGLNKHIVIGKTSSLAAAAAAKDSTIISASSSSLGRCVERLEKLNINRIDIPSKSCYSGALEDCMTQQQQSMSLTTINTETTTASSCSSHPHITTIPVSAHEEHFGTKPNNDITTQKQCTTLLDLLGVTAKKILSWNDDDEDSDFFYSIPPYSMCSKSEAYHRAQYSELSPFEYTHQHLMLALQHRTKKPTDGRIEVFLQRRRGSCSTTRTTRPTFNPRGVIKKYRRSAAGGGASLSSDTTREDLGGERHRSLDMLKTTVDYLLKYIFVHQRPPLPSSSPLSFTPSNNNSSAAMEADDPNEISIWGVEEEDDNVTKNNGMNPQQQQQFTLAETASFIDDRLRAVQKDLVSLLGNLTAQNPAQKHLHRQHSDNYLVLLETKRTARKMQAAMVRYNLLALYLLSDLPLEKYEKSFAVRALRTAMATYRELSCNLFEEYYPRGEEDNHNVEIGTINMEKDENMEQRLSRLRKQRQMNELSISYQMERNTQDEIMAYAAILHSSAVLYSEEKVVHASSSSEAGSGGSGGSATVMLSLLEDGGNGWGALLLMMRSLLPRAQRFSTRGKSLDEKNMGERYPRWKWAVELASAAQNGNYQRYFALLESGPVSLDIASTATEKDDKIYLDHVRFLILARCCASHSLNLIRLGQIRRYNHAFRKGEVVNVEDITFLLRFSIRAPMTNSEVGSQETIENDAHEWAADFCRDAGLPLVENDVGDKKTASVSVLMKSAPVNVKGDAIGRMCNPGRINDVFVFGTKLLHFGKGGDANIDTSSEALVVTKHRNNVSNWEDRDSEEDDNEEKSIQISIRYCEARCDEDGVLIPTSLVLRSLIE